MGYLHTFYALDIGKLTKLFGSGDESFLDEVIAVKEKDLWENDEFFEDDIDNGDCPGSAQSLGEIIVLGTPSGKNCPAMYGYVLGILCDQLGEFIDEEIACVGDHPYESQLTTSGPPISIPYDEADFPEIGYLSHTDIQTEAECLNAAPNVDDDELAREIEAYRRVLKTAHSKKLGLVSFRH